MYEVTGASILQDGKPIKSYDMNIHTENLDEVRKKIIDKHMSDYAGRLSVCLKYKNLIQ
ncbi:MAG: hypothetical protein HDT28_04910 [Clostridiales bacterium]|nr:hypothetical protein [Clostridiales bacterium]